MNNRIHIVVSQGRSHNPAKRKLEEEIVAGLLGQRGIEVIVVPHLYDLMPNGAGMLGLKHLANDIVVLGWLYPRALRWILSRNGILGQEGKTLLVDDGDDATGEPRPEQVEPAERVIQQMEIPDRRIYCLDLRVLDQAAPYIEEVRRIADESFTGVVPLTSAPGAEPSREQAQRLRLVDPERGDGEDGNGHLAAVADTPSAPRTIEEALSRRWYPVIDYSRCTNCMECIEFCLFGVYGIDQRDTILVEQPDNCRKGCPACSRICPEGAILFPQHKTPAIAGSGQGAGTLKIDLTSLFSAPAAGAADLAARERDEHLQHAGRDAVDTPPGCTCKKKDKSVPKDGLDDLVDELDGLDL